MRLVIAGPGGKQVGSDVVGQVTVKNAEYVDPVNIEGRPCFCRARALLVPTIYISRLVAVEAMMCGTPAIRPVRERSVKSWNTDSMVIGSGP